MTTQLSLITLNDVVMNEILGNLDFLDLQKLRRVFKFFTNFIDNVKSISPLKDVTISVLAGKMCMDYFTVDGMPMKVTYEQSGAECLIKSKVEYDDEKLKILKNSNFSKIFQKDLEITLRQQKSPFRLIRLIKDQHSNFDNLLEIFPPKLQVEEFHCHAKENEREISKFLKILDPKCIVSISIYGCRGVSVILNIDEISKMEQWKNSEQFSAWDMVLDVELKKLAHFSLVEAKIGKIDGQELIGLKEKLLYSKLFAIIALEYVNFTNQDNFLNFIGPSHQKPEESEKSWFFKMRIPESDDVLRISWNSLKYTLEFKRIRRFHVPEDVRIQN